MERLVVGIVRTSHGIKGYVKVMSLSGEQRHFLNMKEVHLLKDNI
ncbi:MAG: ribosome maturation factor RimM, partial [Sediminispirochaetaceae bacterium]